MLEKMSFVLAFCVAEVTKDAASHLKAEKGSRLIVLSLRIHFVFVVTVQIIMNLFSIHADVAAPSFHRWCVAI